jgi:hypothetical protein
MDNKYLVVGLISLVIIGCGLYYLYTRKSNTPSNAIKANKRALPYGWAGCRGKCAHTLYEEEKRNVSMDVRNSNFKTCMDACDARYNFSADQL